MNYKQKQSGYRPFFGIFLAALFLVAIFVLTTCSKRSDQAALYNDSIVDHQESIILAFDVLDSSLIDSVAIPQNLEYAQLNLINRIHYSITALDSIGPFKKDPSLQKAARNLFLAYEQLATLHYNKLVKIKLLPPQEVNQALVDSSATLHASIKKLSDVSQRAFIFEQQAFGKKYHLAFK